MCRVESFRLLRSDALPDKSRRRFLAPVHKHGGRVDDIPYSFK